MKQLHGVGLSQQGLCVLGIEGPREPGALCTCARGLGGEGLEVAGQLRPWPSPTLLCGYTPSEFGSLPERPALATKGAPGPLWPLETLPNSSWSHIAEGHCEGPLTSSVGQPAPGLHERRECIFFPNHLFSVSAF